MKSHGETMILSNEDIKKSLVSPNGIRISNITPDTIRENGIDCRISRSMGIDKHIHNYVVDSHNKESSDNRFEITEDSKSFLIPPKTNILLSTIEEIELPSDIMAFCAIRSSIARMGFVSPMTIVDAGFYGTLTIEAFYGGSNFIKLYVGDRFLHVIFARLETPTSTPYSGVYNGQTIVRTPKSIQ